MERLTTKEREQALEVILAEATKPIHADAARWLSQVLRKAGQLHRLYVKACNEPLTDYDKRNTKSLERELRDLFARAGLGLYLNGDPRGNPVGILTPKTGKFNTMGGRECGWRL